MRAIVWFMGLFFSFVILVILVRSIGLANASTQPIEDAAKPDPTCPQPCWHGITIGQTSVDEAVSILQANYPYFSHVTRDDRNGLIFTEIPSAHIGVQLLIAPDMHDKMVIA